MSTIICGETSSANARDTEKESNRCPYILRRHFAFRNKQNPVKTASAGQKYPTMQGLIEYYVWGQLGENLSKSPGAIVNDLTNELIDI